MTKQEFSTRLIRDEDTSVCAIELPFEPKEAFGKFRAPVRVEINDHLFRATTFRRGGRDFVAMNRASRDAASIEVGDMLSVEMELDTDVKLIEAPEDLKQALRRRKSHQSGWDKLSYEEQKAHVETLDAAKRPEIRKRRIHKLLKLL
ncbi:MAG: YdeI/OmpD-associated family protein [Polyangiales bacterium]